MRIKTMTVKDLKEILEEFGDETEVHFAYPSGDHWRSTITPPVRRMEMKQIKHSSYSDNFVLADEDDEEENNKEVLVIS